MNEQVFLHVIDVFQQIFLHVIDMSFFGSITILIILAARVALKKAPKRFSYLLWIVALFKLTIPFSFESFFSLIPINTAPIVNEFVYSSTPQISTGISNIDQFINTALPTFDATVNPTMSWIFIGSLLWLLGLISLLIYGIVSFIKIKAKVKNAEHDKDNVYRSNNVDIPFVLGFEEPKIYLPTFLTQSEEEYILLHEQMHIRRFDHGIRFISFLVLSIHWFNPLVWIAFWLSGDDMEMSCDESVISRLGFDLKKDYSQSLLNFATGKRNYGITPLAFGEGDTKERIKNVLRFKRPKLYIVMILIIIMIPLTVGMMLNPLDQLELPHNGNSVSVTMQEGQSFTYGGLTIRNAGNRDITILDISLVDPVEVTLSEAYLVGITNTTLVGFVKWPLEIPPLLWNERIPVVGAVLKPGDEWNLVVAITSNTEDIGSFECLKVVYRDSLGRRFERYTGPRCFVSLNGYSLFD